MMNIKKILAVLLVAVIAISVLVGCDVITKNEERDYNQELAVIRYKGLTASVTKGEFNESFNSLAYYYVYYYGYTVEETAELILDSLAERELLILYVRDKISGGDVSKNVVDLLTEVEVNEAVKSANETVSSWYKSIYDELWSEIHADDEDEDADDEDTDEDTEEEEEISPRPVRPDMAEAEIDYDGTIEDKDREVKFFDKEYKDLYTEKEWEEMTDEQKDLIPKAIAELKKQLADNYKSYDYYLESAYETQLLAKYKRSFGKDYNPDIAAVNSKYSKYITLNKEAFATNTESAYKSAITSSLDKTVYHPAGEQGYGYVYNVLFKFSDEQTAKINQFKKDQPDEALVQQFRDALAQEIMVRKSNLDYDADAKEGEENSNAYVLGADGKIAEFKVTDVIAELYAELAGKSFEEAREIATRYVYMVNDDTGMYDSNNNNAITNGGNGYLIPPDGKTSSFVSEFTTLGRALINGTSDTDDEYSALVSKYHINGMGLGAYGYCVTDYGIHFMFVSYLPYNTADTENIDAANNCIGLDYIIDYGRFGDENDQPLTLREAIVEELKNTYSANEYQIEAQNAINNNKDAISKNDKLWKKFMKELKKSLGV